MEFQGRCFLQVFVLTVFLPFELMIMSGFRNIYSIILSERKISGILTLLCLESTTEAKETKYKAKL